WKSLNGIVEFGEYYEVSNMGAIRNTKSGRILKPKVNKNGYVEVVFTVNRKQKTYKLHRLVALAFIPNIENKPQVNHKDGNKLNCKYDNLEWSTNSENQKHARLIGLNGEIGESHSHAKLTESDVLKIRDMYDGGEYTYDDLSKLFNISNSHIGAIINRR